MMRILPHLDDVGVSHGSVVAWRALRRAGVVRSASVMVPCPWYPAAREDWLSEPDQDLGVHITLTSEWSAYRWRPLIGPRGGLTDDEGFLHRRADDVVAHADPGAVADEVAAQIERALADGIRPTHIDAHMLTGFLEPFVWKLVEAADRYGIPLVMCRQLGRLLGDLHPGFDAGYLAEVVAECTARGWPVFDRFLMGFCADDTGIEHHVDAILADAGAGLHYYALHADNDPEMAAYAPHMVGPRMKEFQYFGNPDSAHAFSRHGFSTVDFSDLPPNSSG